MLAFWAGQIYCHDANDRCLQPMAEVGMCRAHFRKYSFNVDEGKFRIYISNKSLFMSHII